MMECDLETPSTPDDLHGYTMKSRPSERNKSKLVIVMDQDLNFSNNQIKEDVNTGNSRSKINKPNYKSMAKNKSHLKLN
jgi:hypothetical protein